MSTSSSSHVDMAKVSKTELKFEETAHAEPSRPISTRVNRMNKPFVANKKTTDVANKKTTDVANKKTTDVAIDTVPVGQKHEVDEVTKSPDQRPPKRVKVTLNLPYNSIKSINMPPRIGYVAGQVPPAPIDGTYPFGDTENHYNSMIIHWVDEQELAYGTVAVLFNKAFPNIKITEEAIRRRHIRSLERLSKRYGVKTLEEIGPVGKSIVRRGKPRAPRLKNIVPELERSIPSLSDQSGDVSITAPSPSPSVANATDTLLPTRVASVALEAPTTLASRFTTTSNTLRAKKQKSQKSHEFKKACIVVWKDSLKMDFKAIRNKLEDEYNWSIGLATVEKYYYRAFNRVYGLVDADDTDEDGKEILSETGEGNDEESKESENMAGRSNGGKDGASLVEDSVVETNEALQGAATADDEIPTLSI